jgi:AcrR family transcriptional regulator
VLFLENCLKNEENMNNNIDRRIRRTRRALMNALISLTAERPYDSIKILEITDRADVGYATFYRHFDNKDELMLAVFSDVTQELETLAGDPNQEYFLNEGRLLFEHVSRNAGFYRSILRSSEFVQKFKNLLTRQVQDHMQQHALKSEELAFPLDLAAHHIVASMIGLIEWWLEKNMLVPTEEMARVYERLVIQTTWYALRIDQSLPMDWHQTHK